MTKNLEKNIKKAKIIEKKIDAFSDLIESLENTEDKKKMLWKEIYENIIPLAEIGAIQRTEVLRQTNRVQTLQSEVAQANANLEEVQAQLLKLEQQSLREVSDLENQLVEITDTLNKEMLIAPVNGIVFGPEVARQHIKSNGNRDIRSKIADRLQ